MTVPPSGFQSVGGENIRLGVETEWVGYGTHGFDGSPFQGLVLSVHLGGFIR